LNDKLNVYSEEPLQHLVHVGYKGVQFHDFALSNLFTTERQQLPGELRRAICSFRTCSMSSLVGSPVENGPATFGNNGDHSQKVIEIVGDTAASRRPLPFSALGGTVLPALPLRVVRCDLNDPVTEPFASRNGAFQKLMSILWPSLDRRCSSPSSRAAPATRLASRA
jgi:hypothetical protein